MLKETLVSLNVLWIHCSDLRLGRANDRIKLWSCCLFLCNWGWGGGKPLNLSESWVFNGEMGKMLLCTAIVMIQSNENIANNKAYLWMSARHMLMSLHSYIINSPLLFQDSAWWMVIIPDCIWIQGLTQRLPIKCYWCKLVWESPDLTFDINSFDENRGVWTPREKSANHELSITVGFSQCD